MSRFLKKKSEDASFSYVFLITVMMVSDALAPLSMYAIEYNKKQNIEKRVESGI